MQRNGRSTCLGCELAELGMVMGLDLDAVLGRLLVAIGDFKYDKRSAYRSILGDVSHKEGGELEKGKSHHLVDLNDELPLRSV